MARLQVLIALVCIVSLVYCGSGDSTSTSTTSKSELTSTSGSVNSGSFDPSSSGSNSAGLPSGGPSPSTSASTSSGTAVTSTTERTQLSSTSGSDSGSPDPSSSGSNSGSFSTSTSSKSDLTSTSSGTAVTSTTERTQLSSTSGSDSGSPDPSSSGSNSGLPSGGPSPSTSDRTSESTSTSGKPEDSTGSISGSNSGDSPSSGGPAASTSGRTSDSTSTSGSSNEGGDDDDDDWPFYPYPGGDRWNGTKDDYNYTSNYNGTVIIPGSFGGNITITPNNQTSGHGGHGKGGDSNEGGDNHGEDENEDEDSDRDYDVPFVYPDNSNTKGCQFTGKNRNSSNVKNESYHIYDINTIGQFRLALQYLEAGANKNASLLGFALKALTVFEYNEVNGVAGYQVGDKVTGTYDLSSAPFDTIDIQSFPITSSKTGQENTLWKVTASTSDGVFAASITFSGIPILVGDTQLSPDSMKVDVAIQWFTAEHVAASWTTGPSDAATYPHANVALTIAAAASVDHSYVSENTPALNSTNPSVNFNGSSIIGFFSWEPVAFLNHGQSSTVVHASFGDAAQFQSEFTTGYKVAAAYFSFPGDRPAYILWDPEFGSSPAPTTTKASTTTTTTGNISNASVLYPLIALIALLIML